MSKQLRIGTAMVQASKPFNEGHKAASKSFGYSQLPLGYVVGVGCPWAQLAAHGVENVFLTQRVVFESHGTFTGIHL